MTAELTIRFPDPSTYSVRFNNRESKAHPFTGPLTNEDREKIRWYLEVYAARYTTDVDDIEAKKIEARLPQWGKALFEAVFNTDTITHFIDFYRTSARGRLITIDAAHPDVLSLPWELLAYDNMYLFHSDPRISVRRRLSGTGGPSPFLPESKDVLRLLFVVSRPEGSGFIDPRSDPMAVLAAVEQEAPGKVEFEFLRPATLDELNDRLEQKKRKYKHLPPVDIIHFDGHGVFDPDGRFLEEAAKTDPVAATRKLAGKRSDNTGYLLFEDEKGKQALVSAQTLGKTLKEKRVGLIVLSACQSAAPGEGDPGAAEPMGGVAARLVSAGIPAVIAMTHSVLVETTKRLFGAFYEHLSCNQGIGESLDDARRILDRHADRGERTRGEHRITLNVQDWFLPTLYQAGDDIPLLTDTDVSPAEAPDRGNIAEAKAEFERQAGFFGRARELWQIERAFVAGIRRVTVCGFGGQGKSHLALEAADWLLKTGLFDRGAFIDYSRFQGEDALAYAVSALSAILKESLLDAEAAQEALAAAPALLILDNLEILPEPARAELLSAAERWSKEKGTRVLITPRQHDPGHPAFPPADTPAHRRLVLEGLSPADALAFFQALRAAGQKPKTPEPARNGLEALFQQVDYHPLSIQILGDLLKTKRIAEVGELLAQHLAEYPGEGKEQSLTVSVNVSLDLLGPAVKRFLPRLGVFRGGALEDVLVGVMGLAEVEEDPETADWPTMKRALEAAGLARPEPVMGRSVPFIKFHPALADTVGPMLPEAERTVLQQRHRDFYYQLADHIYYEDGQNPEAAREVAKKELPNLLFAVEAELAEKTDRAAGFVARVNYFLEYFGLHRDRARLAKAVQTLGGPVGSQTWYLARSAAGNELYAAGRFAEALQVYTEVLEGLGEEPTLTRCITLMRIGRYHFFQGRPDLAVEWYRNGISVGEALTDSRVVKRQLGILHGNLADALRDLGRYAEARAEYERSLGITNEVGDERGVAVTNFQLGTLEMLQGNPGEAEKRYKEALDIFRNLGEPPSVAAVWHQLGLVYEKARQWEAAEDAYRESAKIRESLGDVAGAAQTYNNLGNVLKNAGKPAAAEGFYGKAIAGGKAAKNRPSASWAMNNLAALLKDQPGRLPEARGWAEESLAIMKTLDPGVTKIWTTYRNLADIEEADGNPEEAWKNRRLARESRAAFMGSKHQLKPFFPSIQLVVGALHDEENTETQIEALFQHMIGHGKELGQIKEFEQLVEGWRKILAGSRTIENIDDYNPTVALLLEITLQAIENPDILKELEEDAAAVSAQAQTGPDAAGAAQRRPPAGEAAKAEDDAPEQVKQLVSVLAAAAETPELRPKLEPVLAGMAEQGGDGLAAAIRRIWAGERNAAALTDGLGDMEATIVKMVLAEIETPGGAT